MSNFHHYQVPTLSHLIALINHSTAHFPPPATRLLIIESISTLFDTAYGRHTSKAALSRLDQKARESLHWASNRRFAVAGSLISALNRLAALKNLAVLVTSQMMTRVRPGGSGNGAILVPAMTGKEWEAGVASRIVLFRNWAPEEWIANVQSGRVEEAARDKLGRIRFAGVIKANGVAVQERNEHEDEASSVVPFTIEHVRSHIAFISPNILANWHSQKGGIAPFADTDEGTLALSSPIKLASSPSRKRPVQEIADSEADTEDEFGWAEADQIAAEGLID
jgi:hypothetical protein